MGLLVTMLALLHCYFTQNLCLGEVFCFLLVPANVLALFLSPFPTLGTTQM